MHCNLSSKEKAIRAAAIIDTDGCISIRKSKYTVIVQVSMTTPQLPLWLQSEYDGSVNVSKSSHGDGYQRRDSYVWNVSAVKAEKFLRAICPFVMVKHEQVKCALELRSKQGRYLQHIPLVEKRRMWQPYYARMRELNQIGV